VAAKSKHADAAETLAEIESIGERAIEWVGSNVRIVLSVVVICLLVAAGIGYFESAKTRRENAASVALAETRDGYLAAMGASPGALEAPEPADPAAAMPIWREYAERFGAVAEGYAGTPSAAVAQLEQGNLLANAGDDEQALEVWRSAIARLSRSSPLAGILNQRIGQALEDREDWEAAGRAYESAAAIASYTFRHWALADAARCYLLAENREKALELAARLDREAPDLQLPDYLRAQLRELRVANPD
jgi:tetratricopeptide (TPR) repeat protein